MKDQGATVVINHHVIDGKQNQYENWLNEIGAVCKGYAGHIDWQIVRPIPNLTYEYTVIIRFDTLNNLTSWMESEERKAMIYKAQPLLAREDNYSIQSGLDFLFANGMAAQKVPARWKQYLVTWSAIYPLSILIPMILFPVLDFLNLPANKYLHSLIVSGTVVFIMVYLLMPNYTKLIKKWLYA